MDDVAPSALISARWPTARSQARGRRTILGAPGTKLFPRPGWSTAADWAAVVCGLSGRLQVARDGDAAGAQHGWVCGPW